MTDGPADRATELEAEVARLRKMLASAPGFFTRVTVDGRILYINRLAPGFVLEDVLGTSIDAYVQPEYRAQAHEAIRKAAATGQTQSYSTIGRVSDSTFGNYVTQVNPVVEGGVVTSVVMVSTDVTELAQALARLGESQTQLQLALDATGMGVWTYEPERGAGSWDDTTRSICGVEEVMDAPSLMKVLSERVHPEDRERVRGAIEEGLRSGRYGPIEHRIVLPDGSVRWVAASGATIGNPNEPPRLVGSVMDVTERRAFEARLLEAAKLESIGRLAGGIAHDFNNMLTSMIVNVDLLLRRTTDAASLPMLREIRFAADRSAALTAQLLAFARRQVIEPQIVAPNAIVGRLEALLRRVIGEHIGLSSAFGAQARVRIDPSQLEQIFLNLATNARDAMDAGGVLTVETADVEIDAADPKRGDVAPGNYVKISVSDTGPGIPPEALPHIFEPFYSTRSGGTGLGLATCYGIAKQNGGHIEVKSTLGVGTTFTVLFPATSGAADALEIASPPAAPSVHGESILIVEDEDLVRVALERTLAKCGYRVRCVGDPAEALSVFEEEGPFQVLVTDIVMPGIGGRQLAACLRAKDPNLSTLYISGYSEDTVLHTERLGPKQRFLQKPFRPEDLLAALRAILDG